jgi:hypothetical protein
MPIESYALQVGLGIDDKSSDQVAGHGLLAGIVRPNTAISQTLAEINGRSSSTSHPTGQTLMADVYRTSSSSLHSIQPLSINKSKAIVGSSVSLNHLGVLLTSGDDAEDDWSRNVLLAADVGTDQ